MQQLEEGVLTIDAGFTPDHRRYRNPADVRRASRACRWTPRRACCKMRRQTPGFDHMESTAWNGRRSRCCTTPPTRLPESLNILPERLFEEMPIHLVRAWQRPKLSMPTAINCQGQRPTITSNALPPNPRKPKHIAVSIPKALTARVLVTKPQQNVLLRSRCDTAANLLALLAFDRLRRGWSQRTNASGPSAADSNRWARSKQTTNADIHQHRPQCAPMPIFTTSVLIHAIRHCAHPVNKAAHLRQHRHSLPASHPHHQPAPGYSSDWQGGM